ncbi:MAG: dihydropyrimidinase [Symbiobacteriaceae bacterium]|jgi:dihydropyrimidinase|nr:dihydropyrimidinase [Symbiobacteriaceae bacterium]
MATIIAGGTVVTAAGRMLADVKVEGARVTAIGAGLRTAGDEIIDATGCYVLPGAIDPHTHIELPTGGGQHNADTWHSGTVAAAFGGTTTVIDMITQEKGGTLADALADWRRRAGPAAVVDYGFHMGIIDVSPPVLDEIDLMMREGVTSFKLYTAYRNRLMLDDAHLFAVMRRVAAANGLVLIHAENGDVIDTLVAEAVARGDVAPQFHALTRPAAAEAEATARACRLAELAGARLYVVHVTCREALAEIEAARRRGQPVWAETCTHYLFFTADDLARPDFEGAKWVLSPALRTPEDREVLWTSLTHSVEVVASDHCPWTNAQKAKGWERFDLIPNGAPGLEERLPFLYTYGVVEGRLTLEELVAVTSTNPAKIFGLYPRKGTIAPGSDADLVIWDPHINRTWSAKSHHCGSDNTPYEGMWVSGGVRHLLVRGRPVITGGALAAGTEGWGTYLERGSDRAVR